MNVNLKSLQSYRKKVAALVLDDPVYIPIFERIEHEIENLEKENDVISRARAITARYKAAA